MRVPLVPWPRAAAVMIVAGLAVLFGLGLPARHAAHGYAVDDTITRWIYQHLGAGTRLDLLRLTDPPASVAVLVAVVVAALVYRRWDVAALAVLAPAIASGLTELVLKPFFDRTNPATTGAVGRVIDAYPSGHETLVATMLVLLGLLAFRAALRGWLLAVLVLALLCWYLLTATGLVGLFYHYPSDTLGAVGLALAVTPATALVIERAGQWLRERHSRSASRSAAGPSARGD